MSNSSLTSGFAICQQPKAHSAPAHAVGCFKLAPNGALTLTPKTHSVLRVAHGRVWVTFANASQDLTARAGDHFLDLGQTLPLSAGQVVVMEAMSPDVYFDLTLDAQSMASFSQAAVKSEPAVSGVPSTRKSLFRTLYAWIKRPGGGHSQSAHACGQTRPHPFAAAAQGCQS